MYKKLIMTAGPTRVSEEVRLARAFSVTNPDIDKSFSISYGQLCKKISNLLGTNNETLILCGEGMLGLDSAICSLTEPGDRVLVISNGIFGEGFKDLVALYGGESVVFDSDIKSPVNVLKLKDFLDSDSNFKYATVVHCDTPSGVLNDVTGICKLLTDRGILSVVDAVASFPGDPLNVDEATIDICLGGSQKAYSAAPGLSIVTVSDDAFDVMRNRKTPIASFYCNLLAFKECRDVNYFLYTMPASDIMSFNVAVENILKETLNKFQKRHFVNASIFREAMAGLGLKTYLESGFSNTVTAVVLPEGITDDAFRGYILDKYGILLSDSLLYLKGHIFRFGHMGENSHCEYVNLVITAVKDALIYFGALDA